MRTTTKSREAQVAVCIGLLMLSLSHGSHHHKTRICGLRTSKQIYEAESERMTGNGNINKRSLSAWTWIPHFSPHRIPRVIYEAVCQKQDCWYLNRPQDAELNSVPIYHSMLVLFPEQNNQSCYTATLQEVAVGCVCVWAKSAT